MSKRLLEVANELKVSSKAIVEHLRKNGYDDITEKPSAKLSPEMYDSLIKHFSAAIDIKEKAEKLSTGTGQRKNEQPKDSLKPWERPSLANKEPKMFSKENIAASIERTERQEPPALTADPTPTTTPASVENSNNNANTNDDPQTNNSSSSEQPPIAEKTNTDSHTLPGPKILGKIDLNALNKNSSSSSSNSRDRDRNRQNDRRGGDRTNSSNSNQQNKTTADRRPQNSSSNNSSSNTNQSGNKSNPQNSSSAPLHNRREKQPNTTNSTTPIKEKEHTPPPVVEEIIAPVIIPDADPIDNSYRAETPTLQGLKILGKIELDKPKTNTGQPQHSRPNDRNRQNDRGRQQNNTSGNRTGQPNNSSNTSRPQTTGGNNTTPPNPNRPAVTYIKAGTKPVADPNAPAAEGDDRKTPRKRIKEKTPATTTPTTTTTTTPATTATGAPVAKLHSRPGDKRKKDERETGDTVKATMAKMLSGQKRKGKGNTRSERAEKKEQNRLKAEENEEQQPLQVTEFISVSEFASLMDVSSTDVITTCMSLNIFVSINQRLDADIIELVASEYGFTVEFISAEEQMDLDEDEEPDNPEHLQPRAPIVTVMGHVDHGKTSLLDYIRKANVAGGEAGGITQHIGAYEVAVPGKGKITFLDTPGHEAFTAMRARGAKVTDIAVIIVAADDSVMPQTREAISHAQAANVPIIFAINKIDKEGANIERIKQELASMGLVIEEWGGKYQCQEISAKKGVNVDLLLEKILLEAEMLELKGNPTRRAIGAVLEASLEKGRGYVAKVLVQSGTLRIGDPITAGQYSGKIKAMFNERGKNVKVAAPSTPVLVLGLDGAPQAGEKVKVMTSEREAKELASKRAQIARQQQIRATKRITLDDITRRLKVGNFRELNLIVKADMDGSLEALSDSLIKLATEQVQTCIVHKAVGPITESDINLAVASDAIVVGFQVRPNTSAKKLAEQEGVQIKTYSIIYDVINEVKAALEGLLQPKQVEKEVGMVEIREVFKITKVGTVAGCYVTEGKITRNSFIRIIRDGIVIYPTKENTQGELSSLKRFKDSVSEVKTGFECGLTIKNFDAINQGDMIEVYEIIEVKQKLDDLKMVAQ